MEVRKKQVIIAGFIFHLLAAVFSVGYHQCDELFQVFEFAGYKLGLNAAQDLPWEYAAQMRPAAEPLLVYTVTKMAWACGLQNPFHVALFLRLLMSIMLFVVMVKFLKLAETWLSDEKYKNYLWLFGLLFWCLPYFHTRLSSENFSSLFFIAGLLTLFSQHQTIFKYAAAGFLFAFAFYSRFQLGFMGAGLFAWLVFVKKEELRNSMAMIAGVLLALALGLLIDYWFYNQWVLSWWNYISQNLFENKASQFGESPFYYYIGEAFLQLIPPFSMVIIPALIAFFIKFKKHFITWMLVPFILLHFFVGHKELRFLFPVLNFLPVVLLMYFQSLSQVNNSVLGFLRKPFVIKTVLVCNGLLLLFFTFKPANEHSSKLEKVYELVNGNAPLIVYEELPPYANESSLNYFRNPKIKQVLLRPDTVLNYPDNQLYYYSIVFNEPETLQKGGQKFRLLYTNTPSWYKYININNWISRANCFAIYKSEGKEPL